MAFVALFFSLSAWAVQNETLLLEDRGSEVQGEITIAVPNLAVGAKPLTLVRIPAGPFLMGASDSVWSGANEQPVHKVNIGSDFYMGKWEVTQAQWLAVMGSWPGDKPPDKGKGKGDDYPVYSISWNDCQDFITKLNALGLGTFRLPSEAEWEYACRAGTTTRFFFGDSDGGTECDDAAAGMLPGNRTDYMWYCEIEDPAGSKPVGTLGPNQFGLFDMSGNLWEWCEDDSHDSYDSAPDNGRAWVDSPRGSRRVYRGGSWSHDAKSCRSAGRIGDIPDRGLYYLGFRLVSTP